MCHLSFWPFPVATTQFFKPWTTFTYFFCSQNDKKLKRRYKLWRKNLQVLCFNTFFGGSNGYKAHFEIRHFSQWSQNFFFKSIYNSYSLSIVDGGPVLEVTQPCNNCQTCSAATKLPLYMTGAYSAYSFHGNFMLSFITQGSSFLNWPSSAEGLPYNFTRYFSSFQSLI